MRPVIDTNILIDYLNGRKEARAELARYERPLISVITWMEVMVGAEDETESSRLRAFLRRFSLVEMDESIREAAVVARTRHRFRLPDAIIYATAQAQNTLLVTRNTKDFSTDDPAVRVPY